VVLKNFRENKIWVYLNKFHLYYHLFLHYFL
jgi:hypothetical protein